MAIGRPFFRIYRPMITDNIFCKYVLDTRYANDRSMLCRAYKILEADLKKLFEYIEPSDDNIQTYSHKIYELLLRASTEFESNCRRILEANGYNMANRLDITHYYKINQATKLSEYEVYIDIWHPQRKTIRPFAQWQTNHTLTWYQGYNASKHNRQVNFSEANIDNLIQAMAGVYAILYAQFGVYSFNPYQEINMVEDNTNGSIYSGESVFSIKPPSWTDDEKYNFDWDDLKNSTNPIERFIFN